MTVCDEIGNYGASHRSNDKLKNIITQLQQIIEPKGQDAFRVNDYNNFVGLSNNDWPWKIESSDRRHFVLEVSDEKIDNTAYFQRLGAFTELCGLHFYNWLLRRDISNWNALKIPMTQIKSDMKLMSIPIPIQFVIDCIHDNPYGFSWSDTTRVHSDMLFDGFQQWQRATGNEKEVWNSQQFKVSLHHIQLKPQVIRIGQERFRGYLLNKAELRTSIRAYMKNENFELDE